MMRASLPVDRLLTAMGLASLALILGALGFQYLGGIAPCEMCHWQRWPHFGVAAAGLVVTPLWASRLRLPLMLLTALVAGAALIAACYWGILKGQLPEILALTIAAMLAAIIAALAASLRTESLLAVAVAAILLVALSGVIGLYQTGMQWHLLPGPSACTVDHPYVLGSNAPPPVVRCDALDPILFGQTLAFYNALCSFLIAGLSTVLLRKSA